MKKRLVTAALAAACSRLAAACDRSDGAATAPARRTTRCTCPNANNMGNPALQPPPVCCIPGPPARAGEPTPANMAYFGGHVQVKPKIYLVFWGWGQPGAFDHTTPGHADLRSRRRGRSA